MLEIDCQKTSRRIIDFIKKTVQEAGFEKVIVAASGGVDSSTTTTLAVRALGENNVLVTLLPYGDLNREGIKDAKLVLKQLKISAKNIFQIDIKKAVDQIVSVDKKMGKIRQGNIMARVRMIYLYDLAKKHRSLVCGTENKTEHLLGYFTRFGDEASDLEPIKGLYKTQLVKLAKYLNLPERIINKKPSAGLWGGQTDEGEFGFSYQQADQVLHLHHDKKFKKEEIIKQGFDRETVEKVLNWAKKNQFKHKTPKVLAVFKTIDR